MSFYLSRNAICLVLQPPSAYIDTTICPCVANLCTTISHKLEGICFISYGNIYVYIYCLDCRHASENKRVDLFDGPSEDGFGEENVLLASSKLQYYSPCGQNNVALVKKMSC